MTGRGPAVGIDLGGTGPRVVVLDGDEVVARVSRATPTGFGTRTGAVDFLVSAAAPLLTKTGPGPLSVGIGASGPIDVDGVIRNPATLPGFSGVALLDGLQQRLGAQTVAIDNDAVTAALYDTRRGVAAGRGSALVVTLGTGVGTCVVRDHAPWRGADGVHPEAGHLTVDGGAPCYCGRTACWEQVAARSALQRSAERLVPGTAGAAAIDAVVDRSAAGDHAARELFEDFGSHVAAGLADLLTVHRCECVVLGGGGARYASAFLPAVRDGLGRVVDCFPMPELLVSDSDAYAGAVGAALLVAG
ncbi:ROK family protein [Tsukamurella soli]|uniref:Glucokinase n=1 Tax=Tsukamurella soli TaxID=644556 RepID=A0ABP8JVS1_9ACTN